MLFCHHSAAVCAKHLGLGPHRDRKNEGYAVRILRSKIDKYGEVRKVWIVCDKSTKAKSVGIGKRLTSSRKTECHFKCTLSRQRGLGPEEGDWFLEVQNPAHNHAPEGPSGHAIHRRAGLTAPVILEIEKETRKGSKTTSILTGLRLGQEEPLFKPRDIYNARVTIRNRILGPLTPTQAMMRTLSDDNKWFMKAKNEINDKLRLLFFASESMQKMLVENPEILIMDCTYKTNRYSMPLLIISGVTNLNTSFYVGFCFMDHEYIEDYLWVLQALQELYNRLQISPPATILTDGDKALAPAITMGSVYGT